MSVTTTTMRMGPCNELLEEVRWVEVVRYT